jgi:LuxR family maltose regulon positive regulatory protein
MAPQAAGLAGLTEPLSQRKREVLRLIAAGKSNAEIALELLIVVSTAKWHVRKVYRLTSLTGA